MVISMKKTSALFIIALVALSLFVFGCVKQVGPQERIGEEKNVSGPIEEKNQTAQQATEKDGGWQKNFGGKKDDGGVWAGETDDGGYIAFGYTKSYSDYYDIYALKVDAEGNEIWHKTIGKQFDEVPNSASRTADGGYILTGWTNSYDSKWGSTDAYIVKTDKDMNVQWERAVAYENGSQDAGNSVIGTKDGGYLVVGSTNYYDTKKKAEIYIIKTNANGDTEWTRTYGGEGNDAAYAVIETEDGYVVAGALYAEGKEQDIYLMALDKNGDLVWAKNYGGDGYDEAYSIAHADGGGYLLTGRMDNGMLFVMKTDKNGNENWTKKYESGDYAAGNRITKTSDGNYTIVGTIAKGSALDEVYLLKIKPNGELLWSKTYGMTGAINDDRGKWVEETSDGRYIIAGETEKTGLPDVYLIKTEIDIKKEYK